MRVTIPRVYLGTMTFGWSGQTSSLVDENVALEMTKAFVQKNPSTTTNDHRRHHHHHHMDTARIYAGGKTEVICGSVLKELGSSNGDNVDDTAAKIIVGTKAHPSQPDGLSAVGIRNQLQQSLKAMNIDRVTELYLHQPDTEHSLLESLTCAHELVLDGKVDVIGMSNYHVTEMDRAFELCHQHGLTKPTVYQGLYNPLNRMVEDELLPLLQKNDCSFIAYNPLAAGLLTGKHKQQQQQQQQHDPNNNSIVPKGRFHNNPNYLPRFYTPDNFAALELIQQSCKEENITLIEATYRWMLRHSSLSQNDGLLLGASSMEQMHQNLDACIAATEKGPLPNKLLQQFDNAWKITQPNAFPYWRSYSQDMPNAHNLDQGASYSATKK